MTVNVLFAGPATRWDEYRLPLAAALREKGIKARIGTDIAPGRVDYIIHAPGGPIGDFTPFTRAKAVLSLWAGVESLVSDPTLALPLARMVEIGLRRGMTEWVTGHVLRHHLGMDRQILNRDEKWDPVIPPLAPDRRVGILGLGALGIAAAKQLAALGFDTAGWSRRPKEISDITCHSGKDGLATILRHSEILVLLLPQTAQTENLINAERLALLPQGAVLINPGRGELIDDDAVLAALDSGRLAHATLDVFRIEPLPADHPFWAHPRVTVTPHIAAETRPRSASRAIAENIRRYQAGESLLHPVDRKAGY